MHEKRFLAKGGEGDLHFIRGVLGLVGEGIGAI